MVAILGERVVGFMVYDLWPKCLLVLKLVVDPDELWKIDTLLIEKLVSKLSADRRTHLCVLVPQGPAHLFMSTFLMGHGFTEETPQVLTEYEGILGGLWVYRLPGAAPLDVMQEILRAREESRVLEWEELDEDDEDDAEDEG